MNRVVEQGLPPYLLQELDLVVFPRYVEGERYVAEVVELVSESEFRELDASGARCGEIRKDETSVYWNTVAWRDHDGEFRVAYDHPQLDGQSEAEARSLDFRFFHHLAKRTDRTVEEVEAEFHRKHRYVQYLKKEEMNDFEEVFGFLSDLQTNEAATVERARREVT
nr:hypothetical protein [Halorussus halophilus]